MLKGQITPSKEQVILELQIAFQKRHVFVFAINTANIDDQRSNPFLYNTFSVSTDPRTLDRTCLEVGNGNEYPDLSSIVIVAMYLTSNYF